jgi:beige protein homolog 1
MEAFEVLVRCNMTTEVYRSLALFITYAYHQPTASNSNSRTPKVPSGTVPTRSSVTPNSPRRPLINTLFDGAEESSSILTKRQLGGKILEMYTGLLCEKGSTANIKRFARSVTNKVCRSPELSLVLS